MVRVAVLFGISLLLGVLLGFLELGQPTSMIISIIVIAVLGTYLFIYPIYWEKNVRKIESYLEKRRKNQRLSSITEWAIGLTRT